MAALVTATGLVAVPPALAATEPITAVATLEKTASVAEVAPGETFTYRLEVSCSAITVVGCRDAVIVDEIPAPFGVVDVLVGAGANTTLDPVIDGNTVTVEWNTPLGDGTTGILDATTGVVEITVRLPEDASYDYNGGAVLNDASLDGANFERVEDQVPVTPIIPLVLDTAVSKVFAPDTAIATPGTAVGAQLQGSNESNATVESLVIQDPVGPAATPNPFVYLGFTGFGSVLPPSGASGTAYEVWIEVEGWVTVVPNPDGTVPGIDPADVLGTRVTFTGAIPAGASAAVNLDLAITDAGANLPDGGTIENDVSSTVSLDGESADAEAEDAFTVQQNVVSVAVDKAFDPVVVVAGETSGVTIGASNQSPFAIEQLTIVEPTGTTFGSSELPLAFAGFTAGIDYPAGTVTTAEVVFALVGGGTATVSFEDGETPELPDGVDPADVESFQVVFEGSIAPGGETELAFDVATDPDRSGLPAMFTNDVQAIGENAGATGEADASADLYVYDEIVQPYIQKQIRPGQILAVPGEIATVTLTGGLTERPNPPTQPDGSTGNAQQVVLQDPQAPIEGDAWWNAFDATAVTQTPIPGDATLTVRYYDIDADDWVDLFGPIAGPTIFSAAIPPDVRDSIGGLQFVYDSTDPDGFPPGVDFTPSFTSQLRADGRYEPGPPFSDDEGTFVPNCASSGATATTPGVVGGSATMPTGDCPEIELIPTDPGDADLIDKEFGTSSSGGLKSVIARSGDTIPSTLSWSTGGYSNFSRVEVTDIAAPSGTLVASSVFDAFNVQRIQPITAATDPLIAYDAVQAVMLYNGTAWVKASNDPCPAACVGQFPGLTLTSSAQQSTLAVRLVFVESPERATVAAGDPAAPQVGSGVARSFGNDRPITITWQVRDAKRSDGTPALGSELYNIPGQAGVARNTVNATGYPQTGVPIGANDQDDVVIIDVPLTTTTSKQWSGGPVAVPAAGSGLPATSYPLTDMSVTTRNTTPARVDDLVIRDPAPGSVITRREDPFGAFSFNRFTAISVPSGATSTTVTLFFANGSAQVYTRDQALALTMTTVPGDVIGFEVAYSGRIAANAAGTVTTQLRLRPVWRGTTDPVTTADSPILNVAQGVVADIDAPGACPPPQPAPGQPLPRWACDDAAATMTLAAPTFEMTAGKSIAPAQQKEGDTAPVTVTLTGQPGGSARTATMTLEDADAAFWNAFDFVGLPAGYALPAPLGRIQACALTGGVFTDGSVAGGTVGGAWACSPATGTVADATAFLAGAGDVHGVRFTVAQANGFGWTNPSAPVVNVPFLVERRDTLRSGGDVPSTNPSSVTAPGQPAAGIFDDAMTVSGESVDVGGGTLTADADADAQYRYLALETSVAVSKTPNGDVSPGRVIPFSLSFTNTGEQPLTNPVFTDVLPPELTFDPDRDPASSPYVFTLLGGPATPTGPQLPTDPDDLTITESATQIVFEAPAGTVLEVNQTYTITIQLVTRPGVVAGTPITNVASMTADEPFTGCSPTWDQEANTCADDAVVRPLSVPALSTIKYVKADAPVVSEPTVPAVLSTANDYTCGSGNADGFYRAPCVPMTLPGDTETWRFVATNSGTLPLDRLVAMDHLPIPGDTGLIVALPRTSVWTPEFIGTPTLAPNALMPAGATLTTFYTTSDNPCTADLNPLALPCGAGAWLPLTAGVDRSTVRSLKFVVDYPDELFVPGDAVTIEFQTLTNPTEVVFSAYPIAWNTVATGGATADQGSGRLPVPSTEGRRVGVAYPQGPIQLVKTVTGPDAGIAPSFFPVQLSCTVDGQTVDGIPPMTLFPNLVETFRWLPWGAECTAIEGDNGQSSATIGTATVAGPSDPIEVVSVVNYYGPELGGIVVEKDLTGELAPEHAGDVFTVWLECRRAVDGEWVDVVVPGGPERTVSAASDWQAAYDDIPQQSECVLTETDPGEATGITMSPPDGDDATRSRVIVEADTVITIEVDNEFQPDVPPIGPQPPVDPLPPTGFDPSTLIAPLVVGGVLLGLGVMVLLVSRRRRHG